MRNHTRTSRVHTLYKGSRGSALVLVLIMVVVMSLVGVWALSDSKESLINAGHMRGALKAEHHAEEATRRAVLRMQKITQGNDPLGSFTLTTLLSLCQAGCSTSSDPLCTGRGCGTDNPVCQDDMGPDYDVDNVICNFRIGGDSDRTTVSIVRKKDHVEAGNFYAIFLLNTVSTDVVGRRQIFHGVVTIPYQEDPPGNFSIPGNKSLDLVLMQKG